MSNAEEQNNAVEQYIWENADDNRNCLANNSMIHDEEEISKESENLKSSLASRHLLENL